MKTGKGVFAHLGRIALPGASLLLTGQALAQDSGNSAAAAGLGIGLLMIFLLFAAAFYVYISLALQTIADKTNTQNSWLAWIPIANIILMLQIAKKPIWWIVLFLIPLVNIVFIIIVWMGVAEARGKPNWWGVLMIVPLANLVVPGVLAWAD